MLLLILGSLCIRQSLSDYSESQNLPSWKGSIRITESRKGQSLPSPSGSAGPGALQGIAGPFACQGTLMAHVQLDSARAPATLLLGVNLQSLISEMFTDSFKFILKYSVTTFVNRHLLLLYLFLLYVGRVWAVISISIPDPEDPELYHNYSSWSMKHCKFWLLFHVRISALSYKKTEVEAQHTLCASTEFSKHVGYSSYWNLRIRCERLPTYSSFSSLSLLSRVFS